MPLQTLDRSPPPFFNQGPSALSRLVFFSALALFLMVADSRFHLVQPLRAAIANFRGESLEEEHDEGKLICKCFGVDEGHIRRAVQNNGLTTLAEVINYTKAGGGCTSCHEKIELALAEILAQQPPQTPPAAASGKDPHWQSVVETIAELRPHIQADGGDMALLSVANHQVTVSLSGSCSGCMMTDMTLAWLQQKLMERTGCYMEVVAA